MGIRGIIEFFNTKVSTFSLLDLKLAQIAAAMFAMFVFSFWPDVMEEGRWLWFLLWVFAAIKPSYKMYGKGGPTEKKPKNKHKKSKSTKKARI